MINDSSKKPGSMGDQTPNPDNRFIRQQSSVSLNSSTPFGSSIGRSLSSESFIKLKENLADIYRQLPSNIEIKLIDLTFNEDSNLLFNSLIIALCDKNHMELGVCYHILMLDEKGKISNQQPNFQNPNDPYKVNILRVTSDAFDARLIKSAAFRIEREYPNIRSVFIDGCVIPSNFPYDDKNAIFQLAFNSYMATNTRLEVVRPGFVDLILGDQTQGFNLFVNMTFNKKTMTDMVNRPVRSDVQINLTSRELGYVVDSTIINNGSRERELTAVTGFIDLLWVDNQNNNPMSYYTANQPPQTQKYAARLVLTDIQSPFSFTPGCVLLALYTSLSIKDNYNWFQTFRPKPPMGKEIDLSDIGALNVESRAIVLPGEENSKFASRVDLKADGVRLEDIGAYISAQIQSGLMIALDCPEYGPQSWYLAVFLQAALGDTSAIRVICESANTLTGGKFNDYFNPHIDSIFCDISRVHAGSWVDGQGNIRDIRDIDYIAVCNLCEKSNPELIKDFSDTYVRTDYPIDKRLTERLKMLESFTNYTCEIYGYYQRITFSNKFLTALQTAILSTNVPIVLNSPMNSAEFNNTRAIANFASGAMLQPGQSFVMNNGMGNARPFQNSQNFMQNRWY